MSDVFESLIKGGQINGRTFMFNDHEVQEYVRWNSEGGFIEVWSLDKMTGVNAHTAGIGWASHLSLDFIDDALRHIGVDVVSK